MKKITLFGIEAEVPECKEIDYPSFANWPVFEYGEHVWAIHEGDKAIVATAADVAECALRRRWRTESKTHEYIATGAQIENWQRIAQEARK